MPNWYEMTEKEREEYVNQDHCTMRHICVDVDSFDGEKYNMASVYQDMCIEDNEVGDLLEKLSKRQAEVINLLFLEGMAQKVAAARLGISRNSVKTHLARARLKLRKAYPDRNSNEDCSCSQP